MKNKTSLRPPDTRLQSRFNLFVNRLSERRTCVLRQLSHDWKEEMGFWRFLGNDKASLDWLIKRSVSLTLGDAKFADSHVLSVQDSGAISFQSRTELKKGLSFVGGSGEVPGFIVHPNLLLDADDGRCLGLGDISVFDQWRSQGSKKAVRDLDVMEKKTGRWIESGFAARVSLQNAQCVTHIADREADFYEILVEFGQNRQENEHLIVRVNEDRLLGHMEKRGKGKKKADEKVQTGMDVEITFPYRCKMSRMIDKLPVQAKWTLKLPVTPKRAARDAQVHLRYARQVPIRRPTKLYRRTYKGQALPLFIHINVIDLVEIAPPESTFAPVHWRIYTSHRIETVEQAQQIVKWYCWRWRIELLFATVKSSGLDIEFALIEQAQKLKKLAIIVIMAAIQVIQLLQARDGESNQEMIDCFSSQQVELIQKLNPKLEGNTLKQKNPHSPKSLAFATGVMARLGGWKGYKSHTPPEIKTISRGLKIFFQIKNTRDFFEFDNSV